MAKLTTARVAEAIKQYNGNLAAVARSQGVVRDTLYRFIKAHPSLKPVIEDARETMIDHAESVLYKKVLAGDTTSLIFFLKTQGKRRGYTERLEMSGPDGGPVQVDGRYQVSQQIMGDAESLTHASEIIRRLSENAEDADDGGA